MSRRKPSTTELRTTVDPAGFGAYKLARALGQALGIPTQQTNGAAFKHEYARLRKVAAAQGFDVEAWLRSRREPKVKPAPDTHAPAPRPPQVFE